MINEDYTLLISGIQHFAFCRRQWALIHVESLWFDNAKTISGELMHACVHDPHSTEKRGDLIISRNMPVFSHEMGVRGACDVVEFRRDSQGVPLRGREGLWTPCPVEYKLGKPKTHDADRLQLCAQAMCLEEMLECPRIKSAYLYYGETKRRQEVLLDNDLRQTVRGMFTEMRKYYNRGYTPRVKPTKGCVQCSLKDICLPKLPQKESVSAYINKNISEDGLPCENY